MKLKTRSHFFMKYDKENQKAKIKLLKKSYQLELSEPGYRKFKMIVYSFIDQPSEIPSSWEKDAESFSYLKTAMKIGLIYVFKSKRSNIPSYLQGVLESNYENFYSVLDKLQNGKFEFKGVKSSSISEFFEVNGLMEGAENFPIYFNEETNAAPQKALCVIEMEGSGLVIFNKGNDLDIEDIYDNFSEKNRGTPSVLGERIFPIHILLAFIENQMENSFNIFKFINVDGSIDEILPTDYFRRTHSYYQRTDKESLLGLQLITKFEQVLKRKFVSNLSFNDVLFSNDNQYAISQYRLSLLGDMNKEVIHYLGVGESYVQAAERGIRYGIGEVLKQSSQDEFWVSDLNEENYYIRAMLHFLPETHIHSYVLKDFNQKICRLKHHVEQLVGETYDIVLRSALDEAVGWVLIVNDKQQIVYKSISTLSIDDEIIAGLNQLLLNSINERPGHPCEKLNSQVTEHRSMAEFEDLNLGRLSDQLRQLLGHRKIEESIWLYETAFDDIGMYVGKFIEKE